MDEPQEGFGRLLAPVVVGGHRAVEHQEHVQVAGVGHLAPAETTEAHDAERHVRDDVLHRRLEDGLGHVGEGRTRAGDVVDVEQVAGGDPEHLVLSEPDEARPSPSLVSRPRQAFAGFVHQVGPGSGGEGPVVVEDGDQLGVVLDGFGHDAARPQDQAQATGGLGGLAERGDHEGAVMAPDDESAEPEKAEVGIGGDRQPVEKERKELAHEP